MTRFLTAALLCLFGTLSVSAEEVREPYVSYVNKGLFCNTPEAVEMYLSMVAIEKSLPANPPEGCGQFVPRNPVMFLVEPMYWYETPDVFALIGRLSTPQGWVQYGWVDYRPKVQGKPL